MSTTPPDDPYGNQGPTPPTGPPDYGTPPGGYGTPPPGGPYGAPPPPPGGGYGPSGDEWSVGDALAYGWAKFRENLGPILLLGLLLLVASAVLSVIGSLLDHAVFGSNDPGSLQSTATPFSSLLGLIAETIFGAVIVRAALDITEGTPLEIGSLFGRISFGAVIVLAILLAIIETVGLVLCILPGLVAMLFLYFSTYFLIDRNLGPVDAIKASFDLVRRDLGKALVWAIVALIVSIVGVCFCVVGLIVTIPVATIGTAYTYKRLTGQPVAA